MRQNTFVLFVLNENNLVIGKIFMRKTYLCCIDHFCWYLHTDIDECNDGIDNCHSLANCSNANGNFSCSCNDGFTGDGLTCSGIHIARVTGSVSNFKILFAKIKLLELLAHTLFVMMVSTVL